MGTSLRIPLWVPFVLAMGFAAAMWRGTQSRRGSCAACGYDLTGNKTGLCPECGRAARS